MTPTFPAAACVIRRGLLFAALLPWSVGCEKVARGPRLNAAWTGSDTGRISAPAAASWCPVAGRLEVKAVKGDMGFGLVLYPVSDLVAGTYPAFDPGADSVRRPGAAGAARWFTNHDVVGYQSDSGSVELTRKDERLQLRFGFRLRSLNGEDTVVAEGRAASLEPGPCLADSVPIAAPIQ
jgi:hypothetical protein